MGDLIGTAVAGYHRYVPPSEFDRVLQIQAAPYERVELYATLARINTLYMIARAGSGHIGSSFSSLDIVSWLQLEEMAHEPPQPDVYFSSKGHDVPGYYSVLIGRGQIDFDKLHALRRLGGLPGHPDISITGINANTGSLGMGISKAKGIVEADRLQGRRRRVFVLTGDGELQEGQNWEALVGAANRAMEEITIIVDHNKLQSDTFLTTVNDLGDLAGKFAAFGCSVERCDGHDLPAINRALSCLRSARGRPKVLIADTVKGRGVSFMEHISMAPGQELYKYHSGAPSPDEYHLAIAELADRANRQLAALKAPPLELRALDLEPTESVVVSPADPPKTALIPAYSVALSELGARREDIVVLDGDLMVDTGQLPFREQYRSRFFECGIAEQDMVTQAGAMARHGLLPVVHSFACFLTARANEQIYNNASERSKVIYVGALAGMLPGGPGHSHQSVRDISCIGAVPGLTMIEPCCDAELRMALNWCVDETPTSCYLRLTSIAYATRFALPASYRLEKGRGVEVHPGQDIVVIGYGPVMLAEAFKAAQLLAAQGVSASVVNLPWLNCVDSDWLRDCVGSRPVFTLDNHLVSGGQGQMLAAALARSGYTGRVSTFGLTDFPECGTNEEVLVHHRMDAHSLANRIHAGLRGRE